MAQCKPSYACILMVSIQNCRVERKKLCQQNNAYYHMSASHKCMGDWETMGKEALQLHAVYKKLYFLLQVTRESISVLQVTWEFVSVLVSGTASHTHYVWGCNEIESSYDKIISTIVPSYTGRISWVCCRLYCYKCAALFPLLVLSDTQCLVKWEWLCNRVVEFWHGFIDYDYLSLNHQLISLQLQLSLMSITTTEKMTKIPNPLLNYR